MRRILATITALVVMVPALATLPLRTTNAQTGQPAALYQIFLPAVNKAAGGSSLTDQTLINEQLAVINAERAIAGCAPLALNAQLSTAAQGHSEDMAARDYFSHTSLDGTSPAERVTRAGYDWSMTGENIAAGQTTVAEVMNSWMKSDGHRANILNCGYTEVGIGHAYQANDSFPGPYGYKHYWTQNFGRSWN